jgi:hypothetical protein
MTTIQAPIPRTDDPSASLKPSPWQAIRLSVVVCFGAIGVLQGACNCGGFKDGWEVDCDPDVTYDGLSPVHVCLAKDIDGGVNKKVMRAACAQEANVFVNTSVHVPADFPLADFLRDEDDCKVSCELDEHQFPVDGIDGGGGGGDGGDEVGDGMENPNYNAVLCSPLIPPVVANGPSEDELLPFTMCDHGLWANEAAMQAACAVICADWAAEADEGYALVHEDMCEALNFVVSDDYAQHCVANGMAGSLMEAEVEVTFTDALNSVTEYGTGVMLWDDSMCVTGMPCEPEVLLTFSLATTSFRVADATDLYYVTATGLELSTLQPAVTTQDPASGLLRIDDVELDFSAETLSVDSVPLGPVQMREFLGPIDITVNPASGEITLTGTLEHEYGDLSFTFTGDPSSPTSWPAG